MAAGTADPIRPPVPAACRPISAVARTRNEKPIPAADARKPRRTRRRSPPPWPTTASSFIDKTGRTHGIRLRMRPPRTAKRTISASDRCAGCLGAGAAAAACAADDRPLLDGPSPSTSVRISGVRAFASASPSRPCTVTRNVTPLPSAARSTEGAAKARSGGPSTKRSGETKGCDARARTTRRSGTSSLSRTSSIAMPAGPSMPPGLRHAPGEVADRGGKGARPSRAGGNGKGERRGVGNADVLARQVVDPGSEGDGQRRRRQPGIDRQNDAVLVSCGLEVEYAEAGRRRPEQIRSGEVGRTAPVDSRRKAGVARRAPVDFPAGRQDEFEPERDRRSIADPVDGRNQPDLAVLRLRPGRSGSGCRPTAQNRAEGCGDEEAEADADQGGNGHRHAQ